MPVGWDETPSMRAFVARGGALWIALYLLGLGLAEFSVLKNIHDLPSFWSAMQDEAPSGFDKTLIKNQVMVILFIMRKN